MKKLLQMKFMLLLCALIVGSGTMWAADPITLWSEDFSSYSANDVPSGGTYNYSCGGANTMIYDAVLAGGESPELLLQKNSNGTFTATIPLDNIEGDLTLTFKTNNQKIKVETTTNGLTGGLEEKASGTHTATFKGVTTSTTSITIKFTCSGSSNVRLDDIVLTGTKSSGGGDTPTTWTVTYDGNGATSGDVPDDENVYDAQNNTVTVLGNTGNLAKEHYTFNNWNTADDGSGTGYVAGNTFTISGNTTLYAQWAINSHNVTLPAQNEFGAYTMSAVNPVAYGTEVTLTYNPATGYENYVATWSVNGTALEDNKFTMPDEAVTVTVSVAEKTTSDMTIDFENAASTYSDWTFTNIVSNYSNTGVNAHGGSKYGSTDGKASGSIQTKEKVNPASLTCYVSKQTNNASSSTWYIQVSSDGSTWTDVTTNSATDMDKGAWKKITADLKNYSDVYVRVYYSGSTAVRLIDDLTLVVNKDNRLEPTIAINDSGITHTDVHQGTAAGHLTASVKYNDETIEGATVTWSGDNDAVAKINATTGVVDLVAPGTVTFTAAYAGNEYYSAKTATYEMTVTDSYAPGTVNNPYTVALARDAIDAGTGITGVYATGIVSEIVTAFNSQYGNITYNISADGLTTSDQLQAYRGKGIGGADFTSADDIKVGDVVVIYGTLKKYGSTYEFGEGNQLVSLERPSVPAIIVAEATINVDASSQSITRGITVNNLTITGADNFHIKYYNANDEEVEKPSWIEEATVTVENSAYVLSCTVAANEGDERTAYLKVYAMNGDETIYSNLVTITQAKYVPDYATLPFEFDGGLNDIESTSGLTQNGLGTDYSSKPKLKFDNTGDYLVLKIDEAPGKLTFNIKGNGFSGSTFSVQTSADGVTFTDLASYTSIGSDTETKEFDDLADNVRYIKWVYTEKVSGNVGLGNINLAKPITDPVIKLAETSVEVDAKQHDGTIALTYKNLQIDSMDDFDVQFYSDEQGTVTADAPEWVEALVAAQAPNVGPGYVLSYVIDANDGAARTAYLRVYANDGVNSVASDVVTITQAKFVKTTTYTLAHAITPGKHYVIASGDVGTVYVMGKQKSTNRDVVYGAEVNFSEVLSVTEDIAADVREFIISKDGNYYTIFDFDENESGYLYASSTSDNHLKTQATNNANGQWTITIDEEGVATLKANMTGRNWMRFNKNSEVFSCYGENSNQQDIYLFEKDNDEGSLVIPIAAACTDGTKCYSTFSSSKPFIVSEDLTVSEIGIEDGTMNVVNYATGETVPANTGVMVSATDGGNYVVNISKEAGTSVLDAENRLRPTGDNGLTATEMNSAEPETCKFYRLTMHDGTTIGFWWGADGGQSFDIVAANKAYLAVPASVAGARNGFAFGDDATGISNVNVNENVNGSVFDLQGRKVSTPGKGLYIVNGKKVVIK